MLIISTVVLAIIDLLSKYLVYKNFSLYESYSLIHNVLKITYVENSGAAFSMFSEYTGLLIIVSVVIIGVIIRYVYVNKIENKLKLLSLGMILGGSIGNLFDRVSYGYVRDFIDISSVIKGFPIFNLADCFITLGVLILAVMIVRERDENSSRR